MEWIRLHPYSSALAIASVLIVVGALFVESRTATVAPTSISAWGATDGSALNTDLSPVPLNTSSAQTDLNTTNYGTRTLPYVSNDIGATASSTILGNNTYNATDFKAFVTALLHQSAGAGKPGSNSPDGGINPWDYIPAGLISTETPPVKSRTALQQELFRYGNDAGALVQQYDTGHQDQVQVFKDALASRNDHSKEAALERIGEDLETTGAEIAQVGDVPSTATSNNAALSKSYTQSGKSLIMVAQALSGYDADLVKTIQSYDATVNGFVKSYVALAGVFANYGVTFGPNDPGKVFTFTPQAL